MEGLEISEVLLSNSSLDNEKFRLDSEFFLKIYLDAYQKIKKVKHIQIVECLELLTDFHANGSYETIALNFNLLDEKNYAYMVRSTDLESQNFDKDVKYIDKHAYDFLSKTKIYGGELLINKIGSPGRTYLMPKLEGRASLGMNLFMLRFKSNISISPEIAWLFFNTELGKNIIARKVNGTVPLTIDKDAIRSLYLPLFTNNMKKIIFNIIEKYQKTLRDSENSYLEAKNLLNFEIGLNDLEVDTNNINIKTLGKSLLLTGRLDSEHYYPQYESYLKLVKNYPKGFEILSNSCDLKDTNFTPSDEESYRYIELSNIGETGQVKSAMTELGKNLPSRARRKVSASDLIVSSIEGSLSSCALIDNVNDGSLCSTGFYIINSKKINPETLLVLFKSEVMQNILKMNCSGTILTSINKPDFLNIPIPLIDEDLQIDICDLVQKSFQLKVESERLLGNAKKLVEYAIEYGEDNAIKYYEIGLIK
ncbi:restriction endonuclease subunit S [Psychrobacter sp. YGAH215]|uniref:restriction endonuclease subunit S n=1 Tax=Psychrobacter sp. YGAH215 TaxID=2596826 RepID=UPI0011852928|nr:restriction endonuclease subunit S [Psychrobacter sp. YGAH215]TSB24845.1 restriction endonuclease subunit S [Psychrobacter sp. YGAH215]